MSQAESSRAVEDLVVAQSLELGLPSKRRDAIGVAPKQADELLHFARSQIFALRSDAEQDDRAIQRDASGRHERWKTRRVRRLGHADNVRRAHAGFKRRRARSAMKGLPDRVARRLDDLVSRQSNSRRSRPKGPSSAFFSPNRRQHRLFRAANLRSATSSASMRFDRTRRGLTTTGNA